MTRLVLVRHGEPMAGWVAADADPDPGLTDRGHAQAAAMSEEIAVLGPLPVIVSPLRRTRETAAALEARWSVTARVEPAVGEVPSPADGDRVAWLARFLSTPMHDWPADLRAWRRSVIDALCSLSDDTVVVTHYMVVTAAAGVPGYTPDYCSRTVLDVGLDGLRVVEFGVERATVVR